MAEFAVLVEGQWVCLQPQIRLSIWALSPTSLVTWGPSLNCDEPQFPFSTKSGLKPTSESHWGHPPQMPTLARAGWIRVECTTVKGENDFGEQVSSSVPITLWEES